MSSGRPKRCTGTRFRKSSRTSFVRNEIISVSTNPGATAFTVTPNAPTSAASDFVNATSAPFAAE